MGTAGRLQQYPVHGNLAMENWKKMIHPRLIRQAGFTLVEILVVIALIGVLAGILLVAVGGATDSAQTAKTKSTMASFSAAVDAFVLDHGMLPGLVPMHVLHDQAGVEANMTSTQNILLHLLGGARVSVCDDASNPLNSASEAEYQRFLDGADSEPVFEFELEDDRNPLIYKVVVRPQRIGDGPWIHGQQYKPYFAPKDSELLDRWTGNYSNGEIAEASTSGYTRIPDLADAWGQPIIVLRRERTTGPIIVATTYDDDIDDTLPQYWLRGIDRYLGATRLGKQGTRQICRPNEDYAGSRIGFGGEEGERDYWMYLILSHPAFMKTDDYATLDQTDEDKQGTGRAGYVMISAGPDHVFLARQDGPLDPETGSPILYDNFPADSDDPAYQADHDRLKNFDDVLMYGGS